MRVWLWLTLMPGVALAAELPDSRILVAKMGAGLIFVILLVLLLAWLLKRLPGLPRNQGQMRLRGTLMLGQRERLIWVEVAGEQMLLGVAPGRIELIKQLDKEVVAAESSESEPPAAGSFAEKLQTLMGARNP